MTLQSCVRFRADRINGVTIGCTIIGVYYIIKQLVGFSFEFIQTGGVRFIFTKIRNAKIHFRKRLLPVSPWLLLLCMDNDSFGLQFARQSFPVRYDFYPESLAIPVENVSYVGSYYHSNSSFNRFSAYKAAPLKTSYPLDSTDEAYSASFFRVKPLSSTS